MEKAKIIKMPDTQSQEVVQKWRKEKYGESESKQEFEPGVYKVFARYQRRMQDEDGEIVVREDKLPINSRFRVFKKMEADELEKTMRSEVSGYGIHNFGLVASSKGAPVEIILEDEEGGQIYAFTVKYNGSGYPVE